VAQLLPLSSVAADDIENLLDNAFGADRHKRTAYLLRRSMAPIEHLSFAIRDEVSLVGSIQSWPLALGTMPLILVGPVAVAPARQNAGLGHKLMHAMLRAATPQDPPMVMIGDPEYYSRFGFVAEGTAGWMLPGPWEPRRLLLRNPLGIALPEAGMLGPRL
jgi:predicted N-acetyltransferase YhbS